MNKFDNDRKDLRTYAEALWGDRPGYVAVMFGAGGRFGDTGHYTFNSQWFRYARWPEDRRDLVADLPELARKHDVFVAPLLRTHRSIKKGTGIPGEYLYSDIDADTESPEYTGRAMLDQLVSHGGITVSSGSTGHLHAYVRLADVPADLDQFTSLNRRLAATLHGADSKWADNVVLRPPGTLNHKPRAKGLPSSSVRLELR